MIMDEKYLIRIVLLIQEKGSPIASDFRAITKGEDTIARIMNELEALGIITINREFKPRLTYHFELTEKGERLAQLFSRVREIFYEPLDTDEGTSSP